MQANRLFFFILLIPFYLQGMQIKLKPYAFLPDHQKPGSYEFLEAVNKKLKQGLSNNQEVSSELRQFVDWAKKYPAFNADQFGKDMIQIIEKKIILLNNQERRNVLNVIKYYKEYILGNLQLSK